MIMPLRLILFCALLFAALSPAHAQLSERTPNIQAALEAETQTPAPGEKVTLAIVMRPDEGWHDYWLNPGDAGTPLELEWDLPGGVTAGNIRAPVPKLLWVFEYANYVYERDHAFLVDLTLAPGIASGTALPVNLLAEWSECTDRICIPGKTALSINLTAGDGKIDGAMRERFDAYRAEIPLPLDREGTYQKRGDRYEIAIPYPQSAQLAPPYFFPLPRDIFNYSAPQTVRQAGDMLVFSLKAKGEANGPIKGLLRIDDGRGVMVTLRPGEVPEGGAAIPAYLGDGKPPAGYGGSQSSSLGLGAILFFALLGGLLLNLMPCVFPILGLKALSLAKMGGNEGAARRDAIAYSAGVILSVLALGALMLALRAAGEQVGWAFQLQEPRIVLALLLLMAAITANLAGLFEITLALPGGQDESRFGAFGTGVLAAILATPCTGPFMAAALGAALLLPAAEALSLFAALGLGLALPYLLIAFVPAFRKRLPKPGPWLGMFRKAMAVPMALTAAALLWLLWRLSGEWGLLIGVVGIIALLAAFWRLRSAQQSGASGLWGYVTAAVAAIALLVLLPAEPVERSGTAATARLLDAEPYSAKALARYRREGRPVFVYFTADWCVTCKINEATALSQTETAAAFRDKNVAVLVGDFTRKDPALARVLAEHGSAGVPLYLWFSPGKEAEKLPQILTPGMLQALD